MTHFKYRYISYYYNNKKNDLLLCLINEAKMRYSNSSNILNYVFESFFLIKQ